MEGPHCLWHLELNGGLPLAIVSRTVARGTKRLARMNELERVAISVSWESEDGPSWRLLTTSLNMSCRTSRESLASCDAMMKVRVRLAVVDSL